MTAFPLLYTFNCILCARWSSATWLYCTSCLLHHTCCGKRRRSANCIYEVLDLVEEFLLPIKIQKWGGVCFWGVCLFGKTRFRSQKVRENEEKVFEGLDLEPSPIWEVRRRDSIWDKFCLGNFRATAVGKYVFRNGPGLLRTISKTSRTISKTSRTISKKSRTISKTFRNYFTSAGNFFPKLCGLLFGSGLFTDASSLLLRLLQDCKKPSISGLALPTIQTTPLRLKVRQTPSVSSLQGITLECISWLVQTACFMWHTILSTPASIYFLVAEYWTSFCGFWPYRKSKKE